MALLFFPSHVLLRDWIAFNGLWLNVMLQCFLFIAIALLKYSANAFSTRWVRFSSFFMNEPFFSYFIFPIFFNILNKYSYIVYYL